MTAGAPTELLLENPLRRISAYMDRVGRSAAGSLAVEWVRDKNPSSRVVAVLILGQVALDDPDALNRLLELAPRDDETSLSAQL